MCTVLEKNNGKIQAGVHCIKRIIKKNVKSNMKRIAKARTLSKKRYKSRT